MANSSERQLEQRSDYKGAGLNQEDLSGDRPQRSIREQEKGMDVPIWEWIVAILGLVLIVGSIAYMVYQAVGDSSPPNIVVHVGLVKPIHNGYLVQIRAINQGGSTAAGLMIKGELKDGNKAIETSETTIDYVPPQSEGEGGLFFKENPRNYKLEVRAEGYQEP
jgi:uncharacterized protein (TIGR02588 family)